MKDVNDLLRAKIKKLRKLAENNPNPNEARAAREKADILEAQGFPNGMNEPKEIDQVDKLAATLKRMGIKPGGIQK